MGEPTIGYVECDCGGEAIQVTAWPYEKRPHDLPNVPGEVHVAFWMQGHKGRRHDWFYRIRRAIRVLFEGHDYTDMVTLRPEKAKELGLMLINAESKARGG